MRTGLASGVAAGSLPLLGSCGGSDAPASVAPRPRELRTHYFDLSNADPANTYYLVVGKRHHGLTPATDAHRQTARAGNANLQGVLDEQITHVAENVSLPAADVQVLWVKGVAPGKTPDDPGWTLHHLFIHVPSATTLPASTPLAQSCGKPLPSHRLAFSTCTGPASAARLPASVYSYCDDSRYSNYKTYFDNAIAAICTHPELLSFDPATMTLVHQVICSDSRTLDLAVSIFRQGTKWCTPTTEIDVLTGKPAVDRNNKPVVSFTYSAETKRLLGLALQSILPKIKDDPRFGANITNADSTQATPELQGKLWAVKNGQPARSGGAAPSLAARLLLRNTAGTPTWTPDNVCDGYGFRIDNISGNQQTLTFTVHNWFVRHLGLYVRFLDSAGQCVNCDARFIASFGTDVGAQLFSAGAYKFLGLISPEYTVFGIPVSESSQSYTVTIPTSASSVEIVAAGLGSGTFPDEAGIIAVGTAFTGLFEFLIPTMLLAYGAYGGYQSFQRGALSDNDLRNACLVALGKLSLSALSVPGAGPVALLSAAQSVGKALIKGTATLAGKLAAAIAEGEAETAAEDAIPFGIGLILEAVEALGIVATLAESSAEVARSPWFYKVTVVGTHDLTVTIKPDPADVAGFPATATRYRVYAYFDGKSGGDSGELTMPAGTRTAPLTYVFRNVPYGGQVVIKACFYSDTGWLTGVAQSQTTQEKDNTQDSVSVTLQEVLVPLCSDTTYRHRQKLSVNSAGQRVWATSASGPTTTDGNLSCSNNAGNLCELVGITLSERFGAIGYSWRAYSPGVANQAGALGQWYQFGNISFTQTPQSGYLAPQVGFNAPVRLAYDLNSSTSNNFYIDPTEGKNIVRRIVASAVNTPPVADGPASNLAVGRFNNSSDAFLIHPTGLLVSINSSQHCIEILRPSATAGPDAQAPVADIRSSNGTREGLVKGPVCAAIAPNGAILVLEAGNLRIQAFDTSANPVRMFSGNTSSFLFLRAESAGATFLDIAMESVGNVYVLYKSATQQFVLDIYSPAGTFISSTPNVNAGKLTVDLFRNVYTLNYEALRSSGSVTEPGISQWVPSTPPAGRQGCPAT